MRLFFTTLDENLYVKERTILKTAILKEYVTNLTIS